MQSETILTGQDERSFIENARRAQIIECAINAIAELGYANASLAEIAKRAGVSKGVISYHFDGKRELMQQVINTVIEKAAAVMLPRIDWRQPRNESRARTNQRPVPVIAASLEIVRRPAEARCRSLPCG